MRVPTITEKIRVPPLPSAYLPRPRLDRMWEERGRRRLVLVTAGAGFGKTSFLAANADTSGSRCLWYCLDERDSDFATFCSHLREALEAGGGSDPAGPDSGQGDDGRGFLAWVLGALRQSGSRTLVFDDAHLVGESPAVVRFLQDLLRYLPEGNTVVLSSREPLDMAAARTRFRGAVASVTARDLEFRLDEVAALFEHRFPGVSLSPRTYRRIVESTEGWAAGLEILFQSLESASDEDVNRALSRLDSTGSGWFDYFAEEVVGRLDRETQDFLYRSSILPRLQPGLCNTVLAISNSGRILEDLVRRNLFTLALDGDGISYRYHHLFRSFLESRLRRRLDEPGLRALRARAARALAGAGFLVEAVAAAAESGDLESTLQMIERTGDALLAAGRHETIRRVFALLPERMLANRPEALFVKGRALDFHGDWRGAEAAYRRALRLRPSAARRIELSSLVGQILSRRGEHARAMSWCRKTLAMRGPRSVQTHGRILATMGICLCESGRIGEGEACLEKASVRYRRDGDVAGEARIQYLLAANVFLSRGEFGRAKEATRRALAAFRKLNDQRRICFALTVHALISVEAGDVREARELAEEGLRLAAHLGQLQQESGGLLVLGLCDLWQGDLPRARRYLEAALELGRTVDDTDVWVLPRRGLAELHLALGAPRRAYALAREAHEAARRALDPLCQAQCCILLGKACAATDPAEARRWWRRSERILRVLPAEFERNRLRLLRLDAGDVPRPRVAAALGGLLSSVEMMEHQNLFLVLEPERAARVLALAVRLQVEGASASGLLVQIGERAVEPILPLLDDEKETVRARAIELLGEIGGKRAESALARVARSASGSRDSAAKAVAELERRPEVPLSIEALGPLRIRVGGQDRPSDRWRSARARRLFQFLLVHRFRWVHQDQVMEALWPEAVPGKAMGNLWQSVHLLRGILEPGGEPRESRYVRFRNDAYRLDPGEGCDYDVQKFEAACREGADLLNCGRRRAAERRLRAAVDLYRDDFLADSPYEEFAAEERERLREQAIRAIGRLIEGLAAGRRWDEIVPLSRLGLLRDPYNEGFHFHLVQGLLHEGNRSEAVSRYHHYEEIMVRELGLLPSPKMRHLMERIAQL